MSEPQSIENCIRDNLDIYFRDLDGTDPTGTTGHILYVGGSFTWAVSQFNASKFIRISTATADAVIFSSALQS